jgi:hypothetical protein
MRNRAASEPSTQSILIGGRGRGVTLTLHIKQKPQHAQDAPAIPPDTLCAVWLRQPGALAKLEEETIDAVLKEIFDARVKRNPQHTSIK